MKLTCSRAGNGVQTIYLSNDGGRVEALPGDLQLQSSYHEMVISGEIRADWYYNVHVHVHVRCML